MECNKCGKSIVTADRGNVILGNPDGFDHVDCSKAAYISPEDYMTEQAAKKEVEEISSLPEEENEESRDFFYGGDDLVCLMEEEDEADSQEDFEES